MREEEVTALNNLLAEKEAISTICSHTAPLEALHLEDEAQHKAEWERVKQPEREKEEVVREVSEVKMQLE